MGYAEVSVPVACGAPGNAGTDALPGHTLDLTLGFMSLTRRYCRTRATRGGGKKFFGTGTRASVKRVHGVMGGRLKSRKLKWEAGETSSHGGTEDTEGGNKFILTGLTELTGLVD